MRKESIYPSGSSRRSRVTAINTFETTLFGTYPTLNVCCHRSIGKLPTTVLSLTNVDNYKPKIYINFVYQVCVEIEFTWTKPNGNCVSVRPFVRWFQTCRHDSIILANLQAYDGFPALASPWYQIAP